MGRDHLPIPIIVRELQQGFVRPCEVSDVEEVLSDMPPEFLRGLGRVCLLGGTSKQLKLRSGLYGRYTGEGIYLFALPRHQLTMWYPPLKPSEERQFLRCGVRLTRRKSGVEVCFSLRSLRRFYLYDVLLHELGHHVDKRADEKNNAARERYAEWFVEQRSQSQKLAI